MQVSKWGDDLAVRLPSDVVDGLKLKEGDEIEVRVVRAAAPLKELTEAEYQELAERVRKLKGSLSADFRFSREEANAR